MQKKKRTLIACSMMEDEIHQLLDESGYDLPVIWMDRGFHNIPAKLKEELQNQINALQDQDEILLSFGLCGNGTDGISSANTRLIIPKFDDCINMMLCTGARTGRGLTEANSIYLTRGWIQDEESILQQYEKLKEKYDEDTCDVIFEMMYEHYNSISIIDTGCYDIAPVSSYAKQAAELLDLEVKTVPGTNRILKQLLDGEWEENFILLEPGEVLTFEHFEIA